MQHFYPRPPRGGRRGYYHSKQQDNQFLSTPSARRATFKSTLCPGPYLNFYPRPPRGGRRRVLWVQVPPCTPISIHALREEGDHEVCLWYTRCAKISIHALREEGDS